MPNVHFAYKKFMGSVIFFSFSASSGAKTGIIAPAAIISLYIVILVHGYSGRKFRLIVCKLYMLILTYSFEDIWSFFRVQTIVRFHTNNRLQLIRIVRILLKIQCV